MDYDELMISEPAWGGHVYMVEYKDAQDVFTSAMNILNECHWQIDDAYAEFQGKLKTWNANDFKELDCEQMEAESRTMDELLERLVEKAAFITIYNLAYNIQD